MKVFFLQNDENRRIDLILNDVSFIPTSSIHLEIETLKNQIENERRDLSKNIHDETERYSILLKQHQQLSELLETKINEVKRFNERNCELEQDLEEHQTLIFDKTKQADDLDRQLQKTIEQNKDLQLTIDQSKNEKDQIVKQFESLQEKIENFQNEKIQFIQVSSCSTFIFNMNQRNLTAVKNSTCERTNTENDVIH